MHGANAVCIGNPAHDSFPQTKANKQGTYGEDSNALFSGATHPILLLGELLQPGERGRQDDVATWLH